MKRSHYILAFAGMASFLLAATASAATTPNNAAIATPGTHASVIAMNQKPKGDTVSVTYAYLPKDGSLAIFNSDPSQGQSTKPIGQVSLTAGGHRDIQVQLSNPPKAGTKLWAAVDQSKSGQPFKDFDKPAQQSFKTL